MATDLQLSSLETAPSWQQNFRKTVHQLQGHAFSVPSLTAEWEQFEDCLQFTDRSLREQAKEIESVRRSVLEQCKELEEKKKRLELMESSIAEKSDELLAREKEFSSYQISALCERQEEIDGIEKMSEELKSAEGRHMRRQELLEDWENRLELISRNIDEKFEWKDNQLKLKEEIFELEVKVFEARKKQFEQEKDQLMKSKTERRFEQELQDLEARKRQFERRVRGFNSRKKKIEEWSEELDSRDGELQVRRN